MHTSTHQFKMVFSTLPHVTVHFKNWACQFQSMSYMWLFAFYWILKMHNIIYPLANSLQYSGFSKSVHTPSQLVGLAGNVCKHQHMRCRSSLPRGMLENKSQMAGHLPQKKLCWHGVTELKRLLDAMSPQSVTWRTDFRCSAVSLTLAASWVRSTRRARGGCKKRKKHPLEMRFCINYSHDHK